MVSRRGWKATRGSETKPAGPAPFCSQEAPLAESSSASAAGERTAAARPRVLAAARRCLRLDKTRSLQVAFALAMLALLRMLLLGCARPLLGSALLGTAHRSLLAKLLATLR